MGIYFVLTPYLEEVSRGGLGGLGGRGGVKKLSGRVDSLGKSV